MSWLTKMKKSKNTKTISSEETLKDVKSCFTDEELENIDKDGNYKFEIGDLVKLNDGTVGKIEDIVIGSPPYKIKTDDIKTTGYYHGIDFKVYKRKCEVDKMIVDVVCCGYHTVVDASLDNFLRSFKTEDGNFFVIGKGNILNPCEGFETVVLPVSQCMIYEMKREDLNKANTNK